MVAAPISDIELLSALRNVEGIPAVLAERDREAAKILRDIAGYLSPLRIGVARKKTTESVACSAPHYTFALADTFKSPYTTRRIDITSFGANLLWQYQDTDNNWSDTFELAASAPPINWNLAAVAIRVRSADLTGDPVDQTRYEIVLWT